MKVKCLSYIVPIVLSIAMYFGLQYGLETKISFEHSKIKETLESVLLEKSLTHIFYPRTIYLKNSLDQNNEFNNYLFSIENGDLYNIFSKTETLGSRKEKLIIANVLKSKTDKIQISSLQAEDLKNYLMYLSNRVDLVVEKSREEVANDISRLNLWVSIWIAAMGLLGIIVPFFVNFQVHNDIEKMKDKLSTQSAKVDLLGSNLEAATKKVAIVEKKSKDADLKANEVEALLYALNETNKIKDIDASFISNNPRPNELLKSILVLINESLKKLSIISEESIVKDIFHQLMVRLSQLSMATFTNPQITISLSECVSELSPLMLNDKLSKDNFDEALIILDKLIREIS